MSRNNKLDESDNSQVHGVKQQYRLSLLHSCHGEKNMKYCHFLSRTILYIEN